MLLGQADLCNKASKLELKELTEIKFHPAFMLELEAILHDVYASLLPIASDYEQRKQLIHAYNMIVRSIFGNKGGFPIVEAFGSFIMDIFTAKSDLDLTINFSNSNATTLPRDQVVFALRRLAKVLYNRQRQGLLSGVLPVLHARVPVLKAVDCKTGIECDISVENKDGISRSLFFSIISSIDERFRIMSYLMKAWAKTNDINSSKDHTMNSLSIISLVAFHFQTRDPPILPSFSSLLRDGTDITNLRNVVLAFKNFGVRNKESIAELFVALLAKLSSVEKLWEHGLCASIFEGSWTSKTWGSKVGNMSIEDFLDRSQNFARSVGKFKMPMIYDCLRGSLDHLSRCAQGEIDLSALRSALFGSTSLDAQSNYMKSKVAMIIKQKPPIQSVQPTVDTINISNHANKQKQGYSDSAQPSIDAIITANHSKKKKAKTRKRKLPYNEPIQVPGIESKPKPLLKNIPPKRARNAKTTGNSSFGSHQNRSTIYVPVPIVYPALHYAPPQPVNVSGHPHIPFDLSGYPSLNDPMRPVYTNMGRPPPPHHNQVIYASRYHPTAPAHLPYRSERPQYLPNLVHPMYSGYTMHDRGNPQHLFPPRWYGSNHL